MFFSCQRFLAPRTCDPTKVSLVQFFWKAAINLSNLCEFKNSVILNRAWATHSEQVEMVLVLVVVGGKGVVRWGANANILVDARTVSIEITIERHT
jgi:hypothetical protein